jgi:hydrogenase maturation protein HypF
VGVAWDGAGHGGDGTLWGGECLRLEGAGFERLAQLRPFPLPGGERAMREPRRAALGLLFAAFGAGAATRLPAGLFTDEERQVLVHALERGVNAPLCSSIGRLFDAIACLLGLIQRCSFEGQAALLLEGAALEARQCGEQAPAYAIPLRTVPSPPEGGAPCELDWQPLLEAALADHAAGRGAGGIALGFHQALAVALVALASRFGERRLLLSGGCFQNRLLLELAVAALAQAGVDGVWPQRVPCNDGGLALGQALAAGLGKAAQQLGQLPARGL